MLTVVAVWSAIRQGFEAIRRHPAVILAELTCRWCFAAAACALAAVVALIYFHSIPVSGREQFLVGTGEPLLVLAVLGHALRGSALRLPAGLIVGGTATAVCWILCAALGRLLTLKALLPEAAASSYRSLLGLGFLRAGLWLAAVLAGVGALIAAGRTGDRISGSVVFVVLAGSILLAWALLNWLLSLAAIFAVRDAQDTFGAVAGAVDLVKRKPAAIMLTSIPFLMLHGLALAGAVISGVLVIDAMARISAGAGWGLAAIAAGYFTYADFLYITRLAAYVSLADQEREAATVMAETIPQPDLPPSLPGTLGLSPEHP